MTVQGWFEVMNQMSSKGKVTRNEFARGMRLLELNGGKQKQEVLTPEKVGVSPINMTGTPLNMSSLAIC